MTAPNRMPLDDLLAQAGWAKALARQLVRDDGSADDLVQRTWVAALEHPPTLANRGAPATLRRWMASVMRNFVRQDVRERDRRVQREFLAARPAHTPDEIEDGIEGQRKLLEALRALSEPYRGTLYARYFEGLMPREIAQRDGTPLKTVKSHLARGLEQLRQRFDRDHGGNRGAWMTWIVPMAAKSGLPTALFGALIVNSKVKLAGALIVAVVVMAVGGSLLRHDSNPPEVASTPATEPAKLPIPEQPKLESGVSNDRAPVSVTETASSFHSEHPVQAAENLGVARGRVLDLDNRPVGGVRIVCEKRESLALSAKDEPARPEIHSDERGYFELNLQSRDTNALVDDPRWVTVYKAYIAGRASLEATIFVAPRIEFSGIVVDPTHHPVEGAEVELRLDASVKRNLERRLDSAYRQNFTAKCDSSGRFNLTNAPACKSELVANAPGWSSGTLPAPALAASSLEIVLGAPDQRPAIVRGIVQDKAGKPIEGANVGIGGLTQITGPDGRFTFDLDSQGVDLEHAESANHVWREKYPRTQLRAVKPGLLPSEIALPPVDELREDLEPREYTLVLDGQTLSIHGVVVDADGNSIAGAKVGVLDETVFGPIYTRVGEATTAVQTSIEGLLRGGVGARIAPTAKDGSFEVHGLTSRKYDLDALDTQTLRYGILHGIDAGSREARIELLGDATLKHVAGRVVSHSGEGLAGINLYALRLQGKSGSMDFARSLQTDSSGRFDLGTIDTELLRIQVSGEQIFLIMAWQLPPGAKPDELEIQVTRRCPIKLELTPAAPRADSFSFIDAAGTPTMNLEFHGPMLSQPEHCAITDGASEVFATEDTATTMLLYQKGVEIMRMPVHLAPGELTILRP